MGVGWAQVVCFSIVQSPGTRRSTAAAAICATFATPCAAALLPTSLFCLHLHQPPVLPASGCHPSNLPPCPHTPPPQAINQQAAAAAGSPDTPPLPAAAQRRMLRILREVDPGALEKVGGGGGRERGGEGEGSHEMDPGRRLGVWVEYGVWVGCVWAGGGEGQGRQAEPS
jgi:hypothetical protein